MTEPVNARRRGPLAAISVVFAILICLNAALPARADLRVAVSIPPLHSLAAQVMAGRGAPDLIIPGGVSPHGFALAPSQAQLLADAKVVIWIGPSMEAALAKPIAALAAEARVLTLSKAPNLIRHPARRLGDPHAHHDGHDHGANAGLGGVMEDPHYWLDPENAKVMLDAIAGVLGNADPAGRAAYAANAAAARARIDAISEDFQRRLAPLQGRSFVVFHDAYQYLETRFGLIASGVLAVDPGHPVGARHVAELREKIRRLDVRCLFTEPQFPSRLIKTLIDGTAARTAVLDPLGSDLPPGPDLYAAMMTANLEAFAECLGRHP